MAASPLRIVHIQHDPLDRKVLTNIFDRPEFEVQAFGNERDALKYIKMQPAAQCLITDLEKASDFPFINKVRADARWSNVPIMVLATSVEKETLLALNKLKINGYLVKPFQPERLFNDVLKLMGLEVVTQKTQVRRVSAQSQK